MDNEPSSHSVSSKKNKNKNHNTKHYKKNKHHKKSNSKNPYKLPQEIHTKRNRNSRPKVTRSSSRLNDINIEYNDNDGVTSHHNINTTKKQQTQSRNTSSPPRLERQSSDFKPARKQLFEESDIIPLKNWRESVDDVGAGLSNLGNSCFMNAILQCVAYTAPFQNYIATNQHTKLCMCPSLCDCT